MPPDAQPVSGREGRHQARVGALSLWLMRQLQPNQGVLVPS